MTVRLIGGSRALADRRAAQPPITEKAVPDEPGTAKEGGTYHAAPSD